MKSKFKYIEAPSEEEDLSGQRRLFVAGGITGCADWPTEFIDGLRHLALTVYNPRRKEFPMGGPRNEAEVQIKWEFAKMRYADAISFWFPKPPLCPIVLYELGAWCMTDKKLFVGCDPGFWRSFDVTFQTGLVRPDITVAPTLKELRQQVEAWASS
jgi:hypothetical protein